MKKFKPPLSCGPILLTKTILLLNKLETFIPDDVSTKVQLC